MKGRPGLRTVLTGTKYGIKNPKVVAMGLGKHAAVGAAKTGGIITVVLLSAYRILDFVLTDEVTLSQLIGTLATDVVKVGITTAASIGAAVVVGAFSLAIGPILAVVAVGVVGTILLDSIDQHYGITGITEKVIAGLDEMGDNFQAYIDQKKRQAKTVVADTAESFIDYVLDSARQTAINVARHTIERFLSGVPRL